MGSEESLIEGSDKWRSHAAPADHDERGPKARRRRAKPVQTAMKDEEDGSDGCSRAGPADLFDALVAGVPAAGAKEARPPLAGSEARGTSGHLLRLLGASPRMAAAGPEADQPPPPHSATAAAAAVLLRRWRRWRSGCLASPGPCCSPCAPAAKRQRPRSRGGQPIDLCRAAAPLGIAASDQRLSAGSRCSDSSSSSGGGISFDEPFLAEAIAQSRGVATPQGRRVLAARAKAASVAPGPPPLPPPPPPLPTPERAPGQRAAPAQEAVTPPQRPVPPPPPSGALDASHRGRQR